MNISEQLVLGIVIIFMAVWRIARMIKARERIEQERHDQILKVLHQIGDKLHITDDEIAERRARSDEMWARSEERWREAEAEKKDVARMIAETELERKPPLG
jgi:hypothetical protein